jgi:hypothetical protein
MTWTRKPFTRNGADCSGCGGRVEKGESGWTNPEAPAGKKVRCLVCGPEDTNLSGSDTVARSLPAPDPDHTHDLALNRPGATLRVKANEVRQEHHTPKLVRWIFGPSGQERAWSRGAAGEETVAGQLWKLGEGWRVIHSVPVGRRDTDIDHVVIGPAGVFTLNTKNHLGKRVTIYDKTIYVNGQQQPYLAKSRAEGKRASKLLSTACNFQVTAKPVLVIMAGELVFKNRPPDVFVVGRKKVSSWFSGLPAQLTTADIETIYAAARRRSTWVAG